jgi:CcmD family protein
MVTFITAYAMVWLVLALYVVRLGTNQRRLERTARAIEARHRAASPWVETGSRPGTGA